MPINYSVPICNIGQDPFHLLDKQFMRHAFDIHNEFGRFFDEQLYQNELIRRLKCTGSSVSREVTISVVYKDFGRSQ